MSLNLHGVIAHRRFRAGVVGPTGWGGGLIAELQSRQLAEGPWKRQSQKVIAL